MSKAKSEETKKAALEMWAKGTPVSEVAKIYGVSDKAIYNWKSDAKRKSGRKPNKKRTAPAMLTIPTAPEMPEEKVMILIGSAKVIQSALERLA